MIVYLSKLARVILKLVELRLVVLKVVFDRLN